MELEREDLLLDLAEPFTTADCDSLAVQEPFHEKFIDSVIYQSSQTVTIEDTYPTAKKFKPNKPEDFDAVHIPEPFNEKEKIHIKKIAVPDPLISQISDNTSESTDSENEKQSETSTESNSFSMDGFESSNIEFSTFSPDTEFHFSDQNDDKLYSNSVLSRIHALAMLFSWFGAFPGLSKEAFSRLLYLLHTFILPPGNILPTTYDSAHSIISPFIVSPKEYHCCINDCIVYHKHYEDLTECPKCNSNRYKSNKTPVKRFKYLPLLPRIRRLFSSAITSELLQEHVLIQDSNQYDGVFTIHKSSVWKENYSKTGMYQGDCRSLSFALCTDGMNPFSKDKTNYSMWPITLSILNLPSYIRIRPSSLILVGIIPGKKEPQSLNPYIEILVEELMELPSMLIYDAFKKEMFHPSGNIILYVLDYPGRNKVFKCTGAGSYSGCTCCKQRGEYMDNLNKIVYLGHRRFLLATDELRNDTDNFPHMEEYRSPPSLKTMDYVDECNAKYDATLSATKRKKIAQSSGCKGACALRVLPNFDSLNQVPVEPMHLIKNIAEHIVKLLAGISDTIKVRREEEAHNRFRSTWIVGNSKKLAPAPFSLSKRELNLANTRAKLINVPDSYDWKPRELFTNTGMKSHEWKEIICSGILKFCIRDLLGTNQRQTLYLLCDTVTKIHSPSIKTDIISEIEQNIHSSLALLERDFPVSLNVMVFHLLHHLPLYMRHFGPVFEYWMYPFERFNSWLGSRVTNKRYPESTVVETYRVYEWAVHLQMSGQLPAGSILATDTMALNMKELATTDEAIDDIKLVYLQKYYEVTLPAYAHLCKRYLHEKSKAKNLHQLKNFPSMGNWTPSAPSLSDSEKLLCCGPDRNIKTIKFYNIPYCRGYIKLTTKAIVSLNLLQHIHPIFGQVQLLFEHSFGEVDGVLAYVQWYNTDTLDEETNMFIVSTNIHVNYTCGTKHNPVVNVKDLKGPFVTAHDEIDKNKLWILNYNEVLLNI